MKAARRTIVVDLSKDLISYPGLKGPHSFIGRDYLLLAPTNVLYLWGIQHLTHIWLDTLLNDNQRGTYQGFHAPQVEIISSDMAYMVVPERLSRTR